MGLFGKKKEIEKEVLVSDVNDLDFVHQDNELDFFAIEQEEDTRFEDSLYDNILGIDGDDLDSGCDCDHDDYDDYDDYDYDRD